MCATMLATMVSGCGSSASGEAGSSGGNDKDSVSESGTEESTEAEAITTTAGDENGTHMEMWSFVELHNTFYADMVEKWNAVGGKFLTAQHRTYDRRLLIPQRY